MILPTVSGFSWILSSLSLPPPSYTTSSWFAFPDLNIFCVTCDRLLEVSEEWSHSPRIYSSVTSKMPRKVVRSFIECENLGGKYLTCSIENNLAYNFVKTFPNLISSNFSTYTNLGDLGYTYLLWRVWIFWVVRGRECDKALCYICSPFDD